MFIHTFGAYFGMSVATALAINREFPQTTRESSSYSTDMITMVGTLFLWVFFPSFNGALVHGNSRGRAVLNTYMSLIGSTMTVFALSSLVNLETDDMKRMGRLEIRHIQSATLAGEQ
jgi:ammonium transporter Rh